MRKLNLTLIMILLAFASANAQSWVVYDGSVSPLDADPSWSESNTLGTYDYAVIADPDVEGNSLLDLDVSSADSRVMFKSPSDGFDGSASVGATAVFRIKHYGETESVNEIDLHFAGLRDQLRVHADNSISLQRSGGSADLSGTLDVTQWNIIRMTLDTIDGTGTARVRIFLNEDDTPVLVDTTDHATGSEYVRWGDGQSGTTYSGFTDYFIYSTDGSFLPSELALPESVVIPEALTSEAVSFWKFDEGTGTTVADENGALDGSIFNGGTNIWVDGYVGSALDVTSKASADTSAFAQIPNDASINFADEDFTYSVLVKSPDPYADGEYSIFSKGRPAVGSGAPEDTGGWTHMSFKNGQIRFMIWDGTELPSPAPDIPAGLTDQWMHIVVVRDATNDELRTYLNGSPMTNGTAADNTSGDISNDGDLYIGTVPNFETDFNGTIDEVAIFNSALSDEDIAQLASDYGFGGEGFNPADHDIVFVTDDEGDSLQIDWLEAQGYTVTTWWPADLGAITEAEVTALSAGDLVVIGRSAGSGDLQTIQDVLHETNDPLINNNQYGSRNSRMMWFDTGSAIHVQGEGAPDPIYMHVKVPGDPIFEGITLKEGDSLDYTLQPHDFIEIDITALEASIPEDAEIVAANDTLAAIVRFNSNAEYYDGAGKYPLGYRTYFGFGNDDLHPATADTTNYFPLTANARMVYANELQRLIELGTTDWTVPVAQDDATLASITVDGTELSNFDPGTYEYNVELPDGTTAAPEVVATPTVDGVTVDITQAADPNSDATIVVTALDGTTTLTYTISFEVIASGGSHNILFVGIGESEDDDLLIDSLRNEWGYNVTFVAGGDYEGTDHTGYDLVFISESIGSSDASWYGEAEFPVPLFLHEPYALSKEHILLGDLTGAAQQATLTDIAIVDDQHDITREVYTAGQEVQVFDDNLIEDDVFQYEFNLEDPDIASGVFYTELGRPVTVGDEDPQWNNLPSWVALDPGTGPVPADIDIVVYGFHATATRTGLADYWIQVRRSVQFLLDDLPEPDELTSTDLEAQLKLYPNPATTDASLEFFLEKEGVVELTLLNVKGQLVRTLNAGFRQAGKNIEQFDVNGLSQGVYFVRIEANGMSKALRLVLK